MARVTHLADLMHRAEASNGTAIPSNWVLSTDGTKALAWRPETSSSGSVSYGSNATHVSNASDGGAAATASRSDHRHAGVHSLSHASNTYLGDITFQTEGSLYIVKPAANVFKFGSTGGGSGGGTTITTKDEGSTLSTGVTTLDFTGAGVTASGAGATTTVNIPGGGGGMTHTYVGYNTAGSSSESMTLYRWYAKSITTTGAGLLSSIGAYVGQADASSKSLTAAVWSNGSGAPGELIAVQGMHPVGAIGYVFNGNDSVENARWFHMPIGLWLAASTTYWIAVMHDASGGGGGPLLHYDTSGSDRYMTASGPYATDWSYFANDTDSTRIFSIRGDFIE